MGTEKHMNVNMYNPSAGHWYTGTGWSIWGLPSEVSADGAGVGLPYEEPPHLVPDNEETGEGDGDHPPLGLQRVDAQELGDGGGVDEEAGQQGFHHQSPVEYPVAHALLQDGGVPGLRDDQIGPLHLRECH